MSDIDTPTYFASTHVALDTTCLPKTNAERCRSYRARRKAAMAENQERVTANLLAVDHRKDDEHQTAHAARCPDAAAIPCSDLAASVDISRPPKRLSIKTKGVWQTLPEWLREDIWAREAEFDRAFRRYEGCGQFAAEAERNGTTMAAAVADYASVEAKFRADPIEGTAFLWFKLALDPAVMATKLVEKFAPDIPRQAWEAGHTRGFAEGMEVGKVVQFSADHPEIEALRPRMVAI